jgi:SAM-dependent methyltransferase
MRWLKHLYFTLLYFRKPPWDTQVSPPELIEFIDTHPPGRALDLGCGTGTNVITLARHGWQAVGVDFVKRAIHTAEGKAEHLGVPAQFFVSDVTKLEDVQGDFDLVLDIGCFHSLDDKGKQLYVDNLERLTKTGSTFLLYSFLSDIDANGPGLTGSDFAAIERLFSLAKRVDGTDRGERPSAWFTFKRKAGESMELSVDY